MLCELLPWVWHLLLLLTQYPFTGTSTLGSRDSDGNEDVEKEVLVGLDDQVTPGSTTWSTKKSRDTDEILKILKASQEQTKKTLQQSDSTQFRHEEALVPLDGGQCEGMRMAFMEVLQGTVIPDDHTVRSAVCCHQGECY